MPYRFDPTITVGYARVSTRDQYVRGNALDRYIEDMDAAGITEYFTDVESGGSEDRKGFNLTLDACRTWARVIAIPDFMRFQRSMAIWEKIRPELSALGVEIRDLYTGQAFEFQTAEGIRRTQIQTADAEFTRNYAAEQAIKGFERSRRKGNSFQAASGLIRIKKKIYINTDRYRDTDKTYQEIALEYVNIFLDKKSLSGAVREFCERYGYDRIGFRELDFPRNHNALKKWLQNPLLRGHQHYLSNGVHRKSVFQTLNAEPRILYNNHDALFSPELAREIDRVLELCTTGQKAIAPRNPLSGLIYCSACGSQCFLHTTKKRSAAGDTRQYTSIRCRGAYPQDGDPIACDRRSGYGLTLSKLLDEVIGAIVARADEIARRSAEEIERTEEPESDEIRELAQSIAILESMNDPELAPAIDSKRNRLSALRDKRQNEERSREKLTEWLTGVAADPLFWKSLTIGEQRETFPLFVDRVEIDRGRVAVRFRY